MKLFPCLASICLLAACSVRPTTVAVTDPDVDFRQFETFGFMEPLGTDRSNGLRTPLSIHLMNSASREMTTRGLTQSDDPDVLIDFMVYTEQRIETRQTPASTVPYPHRGTTTWPSYDTKVHQHSEGSMHIDLIDPGTGHLVVEGSAQSWVGDEEFTQQQIDDLVAQILNGIWPN